MNRHHRVLITSVLVFSVILLAHRTIRAAITSPTVSVVRSSTMAFDTYEADFNGDGLPDLAASSPTTPGAPTPVVSVALGTGRAGFQTPVSTGLSGRVIGVGDVNGDGRMDIVAATVGQANESIAVLPGNGDGTFGAARFVASTSATLAAKVVDLNGDSHGDLAIVERDGDRVSVFPGNGDFSFGTPATLNTGFAPTDLVVADFNGDGKPDIAVANQFGHSVSVFLNRGALLFAAADIPIDRDANGVAAADLTGDGKLDLVVAGGTHRESAMGPMYIDGIVYVLTGRGDGTFAAPVGHPVAPGAYRVVVGDFTRDGIADIATANRSAALFDDCGPSQKTWDSVSVLPGTGPGSFAAPSHFSIGNQLNIDDRRYRNAVTTLAAVDLDGDKQLDLLTSDGVFFLNKPLDPNWAPTVTAQATQPTEFDHSIVLRAPASDVDQDMLTYSWSDSGGTVLPPYPNLCFAPATLGVHTFTVTVTDGDGNTARSSVTVDFGSAGGTTPGSVTVTAPAQGATVPAGTPYTVRWTASGDLSSVTHWALAFTTDGTGFSPISECSNLPASARSCTWNNPNPPTPGAQIIVSNQSEANDISALSGVFAIAGPSGGVIGDGWVHGDVGAVGAAGNASSDGFVRDGEAFTVSASGGDIWGSADEFHYVWKHVTGDFQIETRVDSLQNVNAWTKAGIMMRVNAGDAASPHASILVSPAKGTAFQRRTTESGASVSTAGPAMAAPVWLRMVRVGSAIRAYVQKQPTDPWTFVGEQVFANLASTVSVGLAVTSHADGTVATAKFSGTFLGAPPNLFAHVIGGATGSASTDGTTFTVKASGSDIWGTSDSFVFVSTPIGETKQITVRVRSLANTNAWAKAGVMIRETLAANSNHADFIVSPGKGMALQFRPQTGSPSESTSQTAGAAPVWLRIRRSESTSTPGQASFSAFYSTDRTVWHSLPGSASFAQAHAAYIGIAVTSHSPGVETTAVIDDVRIER